MKDEEISIPNSFYLELASHGLPEKLMRNYMNFLLQNVKTGRAYLDGKIGGEALISPLFNPGILCTINKSKFAIRTLFGSLEHYIAIVIVEDREIIGAWAVKMTKSVPTNLILLDIDRKGEGGLTLRKFLEEKKGEEELIDFLMKNFVKPINFLFLVTVKAANDCYNVKSFEEAIEKIYRNYKEGEIRFYPKKSAISGILHLTTEKMFKTLAKTYLGVKTK